MLSNKRTQFLIRSEMFKRLNQTTLKGLADPIESISLRWSIGIIQQSDPNDDQPAQQHSTSEMEVAI